LISIDEDKIFEVIRKRKPVSVALNGPEGLFPKMQETGKKIMKLFDIPAYIIGDTCWGSCDLNTHAADMLGADLLFNIGHTISMETMDKKVIMINAYDDVKFDTIVEKFAKELKNREYKTLSIVTDSQHLDQIQPSKKILENHGFNVIIGNGKGQLNDGQVFGCEFYPAYNIQKRIDAFIFLGQSVFHSVSIAMSTEKPTFMLDPYFNEFQQVNDKAITMEKKAILSIYKAQEAKKIGIIIGLKEGQFAKIKALNLRRRFRRFFRPCRRSASPSAASTARAARRWGTSTRSPTRSRSARARTRSSRTSRTWCQTSSPTSDGSGTRW
jgi:2-(3-amino-3-carboxypropyl)histidine synthase